MSRYKQRAENRVGESTLRSRMSALRRFEEFVGNGKEPTVEDVENWVDSLIDQHNEGEIKASTIREYFKAVKYYFETVLNKHGELDHISNWMPELDVDHGEYMTEAEYQRLIQNVHNLRNKCIIAVMYYYARRPSEVRLLNVEDIDMEEGTITFNILKKSKDDRGNPLPEMELYRGDSDEPYETHKVLRATFELEDEPRSYLEDVLTYHPGTTERIEYDGEEKEIKPVFTTGQGRIAYSTVWKMVKDSKDRAGITKNITPKSNRHSRATHLNWAGHTPEQIADQQLVHDPETDVIGAYVHERGEEQVRSVLKTDDESEEEEQ